jgi:transcription termination factor NusB
VTKTPRRQAREAALQALYFWDVGRTAPDDAIDAVFAEHLPEASDAVRAFAETLVRGAVASHQDIDALISLLTLMLT